jgi:hypothetical protein
MLGVAGVLGQEIVKPEIFFYEAGLPQNLPGPFKDINMGGLLAWEFLLMHWVEIRRWQDYKNFGSVNEVRNGVGWGAAERRGAHRSHVRALSNACGGMRWQTPRRTSRRRLTCA